MFKKLYLNLIITSIFGILITSCGGKKENFDIDLTNFKVPTKNKVEITKKNEDISSSSENQFIENKLLTYKKRSDVLNSTKFGKKDPFSRGETPLNKLILMMIILFLRCKKYIFFIN